MDQKELERRILEIRILEQQAKQLEEQVILIDQNIAQIARIQDDLDEIKDIKDKKILAPLSREVYLETKAESAKTVLVNVGAGVVVRKTTDEAKKYMDKQKKMFLEARGKLAEEISKIVGRMGEIEQEIRG